MDRRSSPRINHDLQGILEPEFSSIEEYLGRNTQSYYDVLAHTGEGSWHPRNSTREWIQLNLTAHFRQASTLLMRSKLMDELWQELERMISRQGLPERLIYAIADGGWLPGAKLELLKLG